MRFERDNQDQDWTEENNGEWTKEEAKRDTRFDFAAFLGPDDLDDRITDVLDGKDLLDEDAYGSFAADHIRRRGAPGERGRHEAPGPAPEEDGEEPEDREPEDDYNDGLAARRFTSERMEPDEEPDFREEPQQKPVFVDEPPPRPKVVVAQPAPTVFVDPRAEYGQQEPQDNGGSSGGGGLKWVIALLISAAVVVGALLFVTLVLPDLGGGSGQDQEPTSTGTDILGGIFGQPTQAPDAVPTNTPEPQMSAPPVVKTYAVTVTAGSGGSISPSGRVEVQEGGSITFSITPDAGYELGQLLIDGSNVSVQSSYTFSDVRQDHSIYAVFQASVTEPPPPTAEPTAEPEPEPEAPVEPPPAAGGEEGGTGPAAPDAPAVPDVPEVVE